MENYYQKKYYKVANGSDAETFITHRQKCEMKWLENVYRNYCLDVACDLTFKQTRSVIVNGKVRHHRIDDSTAHQNVSDFLHRLNKKVYGNAYKRNGKKLDVIVSLEGGKDLMRASAETGKLLHAHISIQNPSHVKPFEFVKLIRNIWCHTFWGNTRNYITPIRTRVGRSKYMIKNTLDAWCPTLSNCNKVLRSS